MTRVLILIASLFFCVLASAQQDTLQLHEAVVDGARVVTKADRTIIHPSPQVLEASTSGYNLIRRLALPGIRVDEVSHAISTVTNDGEVQLRINDLEVTKADMLSLDMAAVESIEYIDNPGVRYGDGIAKVINITTRRATRGYTLGADLGNALTSLFGTNTVYTKFNRGKNEFSFNYTNDYTDVSDCSAYESAAYLLTTGETRTVTRRSVEQQRTSVGNNLQLNFNRKLDGRYQFQAKLTTGFTNSPTSRSRKLITDGPDSYYSTYNAADKSAQPTLDLYYDRQIDSTQAIRFNAVGTYINSDYRYAYDEGQGVAYTCDGHTYSLTSEAVYENKMKPFTLTAGVNFQQKYVSNDYAGSVSTANRMRFSNTYAFAQLSGFLFRRLSYVAGLGFTYTYTRRDDHRLHFNLFRPKLTLQYPLADGLKLRYAVELSQHVSQIANTSDVSVRVNSMEVEQGNPDLRHNSRLEQSLRLSFDRPQLSAFVEATYRRNANSNLDAYFRTDDNTFIHTQRNQEQCSMLDFTAFANWDILPQKLSVGGAGYLMRFINIGDDYRHFYTAFNWQAYANAYLGRFALSANASNGWNFMEGERESHNGYDLSLTASYQLVRQSQSRRNIGDITLSLTWLQPFDNDYKSSHAYVRNRYVSKYIESRSGYYSNMLYLSLTWNLSRGRQYQSVDQLLNNADRETGIMKM